MSALRRLLLFVDTLVPIVVGNRTAICGVAKGVIMALRASGIAVPPGIGTAFDICLTSFGTAHLVRPKA